MNAPDAKSTVEEIRERFDNDVERFSNLETGQSATIDAPLALALVTAAALAVSPQPTAVLDLGCGAGNFTLRLLQGCTTVQQITLVDLSRPMLERARQRILAAAPQVEVRLLHGDLREVPFDDRKYDVILAGASLHHLREEAQWSDTFRRIRDATASGGGFWIFDLITQSHPGLRNLIQQRYGEYLTALRDAEYREHVFAYVEKEDTPRPLAWQLRLLKEVGYDDVEVLHVNTGFAAFGALVAEQGKS